MDDNILLKICELPSEIVIKIIEYIPNSKLCYLLDIPQLTDLTLSVMLADVGIGKYWNEDEEYENSTPIGWTGFNDYKSKTYFDDFERLNELVTKYKRYPTKLRIPESFEYYTGGKVDDYRHIFEKCAHIDLGVQDEEGDIVSSILKELEPYNLTSLTVDCLDGLDIDDVPSTLQELSTIGSRYGNYEFLTKLKNLKVYFTRQLPNTAVSILPESLTSLTISKFDETIITADSKALLNLDQLTISMTKPLEDPNKLLKWAPFLKDLSVSYDGINNLTSFGQMAKILHKLTLEMSPEINDYSLLKECINLKVLGMTACVFPFDLFSDSFTFPKLEEFRSFMNETHFRNRRFVLPKSLKTLYIVGHEMYIRNDLQLPDSLRSITLASIEFESQKFNLKLPENLYELVLDHTNLKTVQNVVFPQTLTRLAFDDCPLKKITGTNISELKNLYEYSIRNNLFKRCSDFDKPPNVVSFGCDSITLKNMIIPNFHNLMSLRLPSEIDKASQLKLPDNLQELFHERALRFIFDDPFFRLPPKLKVLHIQQEDTDFFDPYICRIYINCPEFLEHLPESLKVLNLVSIEGGSMTCPKHTIMLPKKLRKICIGGVNVTKDIFNKFNFKRCKQLELVRFTRGNLKVLNLNKLPKTLNYMYFQAMNVINVKGNLEEFPSLVSFSFSEEIATEDDFYD
ncbi:hypothetical protein G210_2924 [Candida maltosa Xu316]|uniref:Uncharacterized protein n=1 Tax=Candida maltosa (strain Xu316) TaxID=1245528 RepID=M3JV81_CANMX|nr:hypothetical protein G210_2924 [Candida maltosa Xu316]